MSEKKYKIPKVITDSPFEIVFERFSRALITNASNSTLLLSVLLPYIEFFSKMKFHSSERSRHKTLLEEIGINYPNLCWHIFRNGCAHTTSPDSITLNRNNIKALYWGTKYHNKITKQLETIPQKYLEIETLAKSDDFILYSLDINNLINNLLYYFEQDNVLDYKIPQQQELKDLEKSNRSVYNEIIEILNLY